VAERSITRAFPVPFAPATQVGSGLEGLLGLVGGDVWWLSPDGPTFQAFWS
jgi:hypothetical protein